MALGPVAIAALSAAAVVLVLLLAFPRVRSRVLHNVFELLQAIFWVLASLAFSLFSIAVVVGITWLIREIFPFLPNWSIIFALPLSLAIYVVTVGWIAWRIIRRRLRI